MIVINTRETYGLVAQAFHWATAGLILVLLPMGVIMHELPAQSEAQAVAKFELYSLHKTLGMAVLIIAVARILWALVQVHPAPLHPERRIETLAAKVVHWLLYASIVLMPVTGWLHHAALDGFAPIWGPFPQTAAIIPKNPVIADLFGQAHFAMGLVLAGSIALHVAGAFKHAVLDRDGTLRRMIPGLRPTAQAPQAAARDGLLAPVLAAAVVCVALGSAYVLTAPAPQAGAGVSATATATPEGAWVVDGENSRLGISVTQSGATVEGAFAAWSATILFDPEQPEAAEIDVTIDIASLTLGGVTDKATSADFLDVANFPQAVYRARSATPLGAGKYRAEGELSLRGVTAALPLEFDLRIEDGRAYVTGHAALNRVAFGVGAEAFPNESIVAFPVEIHLTLQAERDGS